MAQYDDGLVYNLRQNWVQYDKDAESFLPVISQGHSNTISFQVDKSLYGENVLYINNSSKSYLFYENILLDELDIGDHYYKVDSLLKMTNSNSPLLSVYGNEVKNNLHTYIVTESFKSSIVNVEKKHFRNTVYSSFFIITSILLLLALILIKLNSSDLFSQYSAVSRVFNFNTIDEIIYKGRFFVNPGIQMIIWMSFSAAHVFYFFSYKLNIYIPEITWLTFESISYHMFFLFIIALGFLIFFLMRFFLIKLMAAIFDMSSISNIHYATYLRLTFYFLLFLLTLITIDYFSIISIGGFIFLTILFSILFLIILMIAIRVSFIIRHPFVQLFLYLCGTEIFLFVFVYNLVAGV